jgi:hypothetical protein
MHVQIEAALKTCEEWNGRLPMAEEVEKWAKAASLAKVSRPKHIKYEQLIPCLIEIGGRTWYGVRGTAAARAAERCGSAHCHSALAGLGLRILSGGGDTRGGGGMAACHNAVVGTGGECSAGSGGQVDGGRLNGAGGGRTGGGCAVVDMHAKIDSPRQGSSPVMRAIVQ